MVHAGAECLARSPIAIAVAVAAVVDTAVIDATEMFAELSGDRSSRHCRSRRPSRYASRRSCLLC